MIFNGQKDRGFTLIELMIVVAILAILAAVAIVAYRQYIVSARNSEATSVLADVRIKQEAYRATFHQYANPNAGSVWIPDTTPGENARDWPTAGGLNTLAGQWRQLGVTPDRTVYFSYACESGPPGDDGTLFADQQLGTNTGDFWFGAVALQDLDGDGECEGFETYSGTGKMIELTPGFSGYAGECPSSF